VLPFVREPFPPHGGFAGSEGCKVVRYRVESLLRHDVDPIQTPSSNKRVRLY
jgi:hypothetical protein